MTRSLLLVSFVCLGCTGSISASLPEDPPPNVTHASPMKPAAQPPASVTPPRATGLDAVLGCERGRPRAASASPLRRLSRTEYLNTVKDLFPGVTLPALDVPGDKSADGYDNSHVTQTLTPQLLDGYADAARIIATTVVGSLSKVAGCDPALASCRTQLVRGLGARAFRRPLSDEELTRYQGFLDAQVARYDVATGSRMLMEAFLLSGHFLYRPEIGSGGRLTGHEVASRLSYFLWQSLPDATLLDAATRGELATPEGVRKQATRLLADARAKAALADFHDQWLALRKMTEMIRDAKRFPEFNGDLPGAFYKSVSRFVGHQFWEGEGTLSALLLSPKTFLNDRVAPVYGMTVTGGDLQMMEIAGQPRAGLLTQAGLLASLAHEQFEAPILRGVYVREHLLCAPLPPPPPDVGDLPPAPAMGTPRTLRQRIEESHSPPACAACHASIDPIGFAFNNYDAIGRYRTKDNGQPVDARGVIPRIGDVEGAVDGAVQLAQKLAGSEQVGACAARNLFRFALGRLETEADACAIADAWRASGSNLREYVVQLVASDVFRGQP